jgi:GNAT superfamily N-acetyltransferase
MSLEVRPLKPGEIAGRLDDLARLRIEVFRDWPYLYDGDMAYERAYLAPYRESPQAVIIGAFADGALVGAATGTPLADHASEFGAAADALGVGADRVFYCAESVLRAPYRGRGAGHAFFDLREDHALRHGFDHSAFCAVERDAAHPARPRTWRDLQPFWKARGYHPTDAVATLSWKDVGEAEQSAKPLRFWIKRLTPRRDAALQV